MITVTVNVSPHELLFQVYASLTTKHFMSWLFSFFFFYNYRTRAFSFLAFPSAKLLSARQE